MNDKQLEEIEEKANEHPASWYVLDLIAELRQVRKERDWLAEQLAKTTDTNKGAWLETAREATCQKKN